MSPKLVRQTVKVGCKWWCRAKHPPTRGTQKGLSFDYKIILKNSFIFKEW
jgi:hypothetical protein